MESSWCDSVPGIKGEKMSPRLATASVGQARGSGRDLGQPWRDGEVGGTEDQGENKVSSKLDLPDI